MPPTEAIRARLPCPWPTHVTVGIAARSPTDLCCKDLDEYEVVPIAERATPDWVSDRGRPACRQGAHSPRLCRALDLGD
jgi:hypothetical protein